QNMARRPSSFRDFKSQTRGIGSHERAHGVSIQKLDSDLAKSEAPVSVADKIVPKGVPIGQMNFKTMCGELLGRNDVGQAAFCGQPIMTGTILVRNRPKDASTFRKCSTHLKIK